MLQNSGGIAQLKKQHESTQEQLEHWDFIHSRAEKILEAVKDDEKNDVSMMVVVM